MFIDTAYDFDSRRQIGKAAVQYIVDRSRSGLGIGGKPFGKYSKAYMHHQDFKVAKDGEVEVNLTLTGDMLDTLDVIDASVAGRIVIGYEDGPESDKSVFMEDKGYAFLGLTDSEIESILSDFEDPTVSLNDVIRELLDVE